MGGGGGETTNVTNTGLGDEQFTTLTQNQANIGTSIDVARTDATGRFNTLDGTLSNIRGDISGVGTNLSSGFTNLQDLMGQNMEANRQGFTGVTNNINQATGQIQTGMQTGFDGVNQNLTTGFGTMDDTMDERFNRVDTAQQTAQTAIDTGFQDTANNFSDLNTRLTDDFTAAQQTMDTGFADVGEGLNDLDTNTQNRLDTVQGNVLTGQALLDQGITGMSDAQDIYYGDLSQRQMEIQQGQDGFQSTFDDYVQRYSEDTTLANQTRADIQTGLVNATDRIRTDMGNFAQAAATGDATLSSQLSDTERANRDALGNLNTAVQGGFTGQAMANQQAQQNLVTRLGNLGSMVDTVGSTLDTNTRQQYSSLMSSFDDSGNLIRNSIDAQGNTIQRSMDDQGNLVLSRFDQAGTQIDQVGMNVNDMLTNAERYQQSLTGQIGDFQSTTDQGFTQVRREIGTNFDLGQQQAASLFDAQRGAISRQGMDIINTVGSQIGNLDQSAQQQYQSLSQAFDQNGNLVTQSVDDLGNSISRQMDENGNLTIRRLDQTGRMIDQSSLNVTGLLSDLGTRTGTLQNTQTSLADRVNQGFSSLDQGLMSTQQAGMEQFQQLQGSIGTGFSTAQQQAASLFDTQRSAISRQGLEILNTVGSQIGNLDQATQQQYQSLSQAFDANGNLVAQSVDDLGNSISRQMDQNGNLTIRRLDETGRQIDQSSINVTSLLGDLGNRTGTLQNTQTSLADRLNQGFASMSDRQQGGFDALQRGQERLGQTTGQGFSDVNQGLMAAQQNNMTQLQRMSTDIMSGFDAANGVMDTQTRDIAKVAAQQGNLNDNMRQQFNQIGDAFDDNGRLIQNSIMANGNIISRNIDDNGNLLLRAFDTTGRTIGNQVVNINRALVDLSQLDFYAGANVSMGNLSPAMRGEVPTEGFASPFTTTR